MARLLTILSLILAVLLFPPAVLALISNNAVPGDTTYPIKRTLEDGIFAIASLNSVTKAWFAAARSDRRFKEFSTLIAQGKSASDTLNELVIQTETAASEIKKIDDPVKKQEFINQLSQSIDKYDQKLQEVTQNLPPIPRPSSTSQPTPVATPVPSASVVITTPQPTASARPTVSPPPSEVPKPTFTPSPTQAPTRQPAINPHEIDEAKKKLEEIKKKLEEEKELHKEKVEEKKEETKQHNPEGEKSPQKSKK